MYHIYTICILCTHLYLHYIYNFIYSYDSTILYDLLLYSYCKVYLQLYLHYTTLRNTFPLYLKIYWDYNLYNWHYNYSFICTIYNYVIIYTISIATFTSCFHLTGFTAYSQLYVSHVHTTLTLGLQYICSYIYSMFHVMSCVTIFIVIFIVLLTIKQNISLVAFLLYLHYTHATFTLMYSTFKPYVCYTHAIFLPVRIILLINKQRHCPPVWEWIGTMFPTWLPKSPGRGFRLPTTLYRISSIKYK